MSLLWVEGFETFKASATSLTAADLAKKYGLVSVITNPIIATGRTTGGLALNAGDTSSTGALITPSIADDDIFVAGFGFKIGDVSAGVNGQAILRVYDIDENNKLSINVTTAGELTISAGGAGHSISGSSSGLGLTDDTWVYIEVYALFHASAGQIIVKVDGVTEIDTGSVDTIPTGYATNWNRVGILFSVFATSTLGYYFDDWYVLDGNGSINNDILGPQEVRAIFPNADVTSDFTPSTGIDNYALVDEATYDEADYVESATPGNIDLYEYSALSLNKTINGIAVLTSARKTNSEFMNLISKSESNAVASDGSAYPVRGGYETAMRIIEQNPDGPAAWTKTTLDAARFGFEVD